MQHYENVELLGNLTTPNFYPSKEGKKACFKASVAIRKSKEAPAKFRNIVAYGDMAESLEKRVEKGQEVRIYGSLVSTSYEKDGKTIEGEEIVVKDFTVGFKSKQTASDGSN